MISSLHLDEHRLEMFQCFSKPTANEIILSNFCEYRNIYHLAQICPYSK